MSDYFYSLEMLLDQDRFCMAYGCWLYEWLEVIAEENNT